IYSSVGYKVILTDCKSMKGIVELRKCLKNNVSALAGQSGVGKSTITNILLGETKTIIGEISQKNKKGKNTTTEITLYEIENNTYLLDTPGFQTMDIYEIESKDLDKYFIDFRKYIKNCEFIGCTHIKEEKCGIKEALNEGKILKERYDNFVKIYKELKDKEEHKW
ncbi:MAG: ribosome small subunit-dependent GTPase A, partial [Clostridia bacterium]|nr:ribosome small subunit-dependent GTPase A [Clostridia bacterium]